MNITENFTLEELLSSTHNEIKNVPDEEQKSNLIALTVHVLQPLRDITGKSMPINSGFRCPELNAKVGGVPTSQHTKGQAADIGLPIGEEIHKILIDNNIEFDQIGVYRNFFHISYRKNGGNRRMKFYGKF